MKSNLFLLGLAAIALLLSACNQPAQPTSSGLVGGDRAIADVYCSTSNEQANTAYNSALDMDEKGDYAEAERLYRQAIELDPQYCDAMDNLGLVLRQQGKVDEAISWYQKSLEILPDNSVALLNLASAYLRQGNTSLAKETFEELIRVAPDNPEGYFGMGKVYMNLGQYEQAIASLKKAENIYAEINSPWIMDAQYLLSYAHFMLDDYATAKAYAEIIYDTYQEDGPINYIMGMGFLTQNPPKIASAQKYIFKAQELGVEIPIEVLDALEGK